MLKRLSRPTGRKLALLFCCGTVLLASGTRAHAQGRNKTDDLLALIEAQAEMIAVLDARVVELEAKLDAVSVDELGDMYIVGVNLHIRNGKGTTESTNSTGNLIIGYNENVVRTGSHNLVVGRNHDFSSYGGIVAGFSNEISAPFATVTGGRGNRATGYSSSVSGGQENEANAFASSVSAGRFNLASNKWSSVSGGEQNTAEGEASSVSAGLFNLASGTYSSVTGGQEHDANGFASSVSGGVANLASGSYSSVSGGGVGHAIGYAATVLGGIGNNASVDYSIVPTTLGDP